MEDTGKDNKGADKLTRQTSSDVKLFKRSSASTNRAPESSEDVEREVPGHLVWDQYGDFYDMSGDKYLVIFNQHEFKSTVYFNYQKYSPRNGTFSDVKSLQKTFGDLGFKVTAHDDLEYNDIMDTINNLCEADHKNTSCLAVAILTHGERGGEVCAADRSYPVTDITSMLQQTPGLAGKPKLLFVQACRGQKVDEGHRITLDADNVSVVIPSHADCLVLYSSFEDHLSFRDLNGSWMIQSLCSVVSEYHQTLDILQMMTLVHRTVALRFTNTPTNKAMHNKKQIPEARFTLTKFLKFSTD